MGWGMKQLTLASPGFERYAKTTRRAAFLAEMERVVPWPALCARIEPFYPKPGNGRPPVGVERMLRIYFLQHWFNLSDPAIEEALYDSLAMRRFVGVDLGREPVPDETTVRRFRHLLEEHDLGRPLFDEVQRHLADRGLEGRCRPNRSSAALQRAARTLARPASRHAQAALSYGPNNGFQRTLPSPPDSEAASKRTPKPDGDSASSAKQPRPKPSPHVPGMHASRYPTQLCEPVT
jgi:IS5 family transposase